jgi:hypothetical protein
LLSAGACCGLELLNSQQSKGLDGARLDAGAARILCAEFFMAIVRQQAWSPDIHMEIQANA